MSIDAATARRVRERARHRCEYCLLPASASPLALPLDHIIARQHLGDDDPGNLAQSCFGCNSAKGPNIASISVRTGKLVRLFHPRRDRWADHFAWDGPWLRGLTDIGAATIRVLAINREDALDFRAQLMREGVSFEPSDQPAP